MVWEAPKRRKIKKGAAGKKGAAWKFKKKKRRAKQPATTAADACEEPDCGCEETAAGTGQAALSASAEKLLAVTHPPSSAAAGHQTTDLVFVKRPADLKKIESDEVQLVVWRRSSVPGFVTALSDPTLAAEGLPDFAGMVTPDTVVQTISSRLRAQKNRALTDGGVAELVDELDQLVRVFVEITGSTTVHVKLEVLDDNGCAFWHQDSVPYRVCATYRGPCTEWVHPDHSDATLRRRQFDSKHTQALTHHDVALFKGRGETFRGDSLLGNPGIVHRSPRVEGTGIYRVVAILDIPQEGMHF